MFQRPLQVALLSGMSRISVPFQDIFAKPVVISKRNMVCRFLFAVFTLSLQIMHSCKL